MAQSGWLRADWGASENNRRARYYSITAAGRKQLVEEERSWAQLTEAVARVAFSPSVTNVEKRLP